jgi:hypothetical protein
VESVPGPHKCLKIPALSPNFLTFKELENRFQGTNSARLCSLAGRYDNPIPTRFQAPIDCLKIPAQYDMKYVCKASCVAPSYTAKEWDIKAELMEPTTPYVHTNITAGNPKKDIE